jgi:hypothetical protein
VLRCEEIDAGLKVLVHRDPFSSFPRKREPSLSIRLR